MEKLLSVVKDGQNQRIMFPPEELQIISFVLDYARAKHGNQRRRNGKPYIVHPIAVAKTLVEYKADYISICAGLLHDVVEEQVDAYQENNPTVSDEKLSSLEGKLFITLQEDILSNFAHTVVEPPLLPMGKGHMSCDIVKECVLQFSDLRNSYKERTIDDMGNALYVQLKKPREIRKGRAEIMQEMERLMERKERQLEREVPSKAKRRLREKYGFGQEENDALDRVVHYTYDLCVIVDIVKLLTREKGIFYFNSIENMLLEEDEEKKKHTLLVKMADILDNIRDMQKVGVHTNSMRLYRCFKNMFVLNCIKNYFVLAGMKHEEPPYKLLSETCRMTRSTLCNITNSLRCTEVLKQIKGKEEEAFNNRIKEYFYCMHGHKDVLEKTHNDPAKQYLDAVLFTPVIEKLAMDDRYVNSGLLSTFRKD